jgi:hypothetical protein
MLVKTILVNGPVQPVITIPNTLTSDRFINFSLVISITTHYHFDMGDGFLDNHTSQKGVINERECRHKN